MRTEFPSYTFCEGKTGGGQYIQFTCDPNKEAMVTDLLKLIRDITIPTEHRVDISHGGYGRYSRYAVKQLKYAGGGNGYIEVLSIANPPDKRCGFILNEGGGHSHTNFTEWKTEENAIAAWESKFRQASDDTVRALPGFIRMVPCGLLVPWFYAVGDQELIGDFVFPADIQDDPVFRFGKRFIVTDSDDVTTIKTCLGCRVFRRKDDFHPYTERTVRIVFWDDGTRWEEPGGTQRELRPLEDDELWIDAALHEFRRLIAGKLERFSIPFFDGFQFVGRIVQSKRRGPTVQGRYNVAVHIKGRAQPRVGWTSFTPTLKAPDLFSYIEKRLAEHGLIAERIEVKEHNTTQKGKKWPGIFYSRNTEPENA
jgi:hypothetical protein